MEHEQRLFTLDELLYYVKFSMNLHCSKVLTQQVMQSLANDLTTQGLVSHEVMMNALVRNNIDAMICAGCKRENSFDALIKCQGCMKSVHSMCFWKPGAYCNRSCMNASKK